MAAIRIAATALACAAGVVAAQPVNDECAAAETISGFGLFPYDTSLATSNAGSPGPNITNDIWYQWSDATGGPVQLSTCAFAGYDTRAAVYTGACGALVEVASNDDACGLQTIVNFFADPGVTYVLRVGGFGAGDLGPAAFEMTSVGLTTVADVTNPANGNRYLLVNASSWSFADRVARFLGGNLVTINDAEENEFVRAQVLGFDGVDRRCWIGYNDIANEGQFVWTSGQTPGYENWNFGEPNNSGNIEDVAEMLGSNGQWNDQSDSGGGFVQFAVVEIEATVACPPDLNDDGVLNIFDIFAYFNAFGAGDLVADFAPVGSPDGALNIFDIFEFFAQFGAGC